MPVQPAKNVLRKTIFLSFKKGFLYLFFLVPIWLIRLCCHLIALLPFFLSLALPSSTWAKTVPWVKSPIVLYGMMGLSILLYLFFVLPLLFSKARVVTNILNDRPFSLWGILSFSDYGKKLKAALSHLASNIPWCLPFILLSAYLYVGTKRKDSGAFIDFYESITTFLGPTVSIGSTLIIGVAIVLFSLLLAAYGLLRNSSYPYAFVLFNGKKGTVRRQMNILLKHHRFDQLIMGFVRFVANLPLYAVITLLALSGLYAKSPGLFSFLSFLPKLSYGGTLWLLPATVAGFALILLMVPFRMLLPAALMREVQP